MTGIFPVRPTSKAVTKYTYGPILHKIWAQPVFKKNFSEALYVLCEEVNVTFVRRNISVLPPIVHKFYSA